MSKQYMNKVFQETFDANFKPSSNNHVPKEYWQFDEIDRPEIRKPDRKDRGYFNAEEEK